MVSSNTRRQCDAASAFLMVGEPLARLRSATPISALSVRAHRHRAQSARSQPPPTTATGTDVCRCDASNRCVPLGCGRPTEDTSGSGCAGGGRYSSCCGPGLRHVACRGRNGRCGACKSRQVQVQPKLSKPKVKTHMQLFTPSNGFAHMLIHIRIYYMYMYTYTHAACVYVYIDLYVYIYVHV